MINPQNTRLAFETVSGLTFYVKGGVVNAVKSKFISMPQYLGEDTSKFPKSLLGTPVISNITFGDPKGNNSYIDINGKTISYDSVTLELVLLTVTQNKNIVKIGLQGRNGTVKEYISDGDYQIDLKGIVSDKNNNYPEQLLQDIINITKIPSEIPVTSAYLALFGIYYVVIDTGSKFPQTEGFRNQLEFTIPMLSDYPIDLNNQETQQPGQDGLIADFVI